MNLLILIAVSFVCIALSVVIYHEIKKRDPKQKEHWILSMLLENPYYGYLVKTQKQTIENVLNSYLNISLTVSEAKQKGFVLVPFGFSLVTHEGRQMESERNGEVAVRDIVGFTINPDEMKNIMPTNVESLKIRLGVKHPDGIYEHLTLIFIGQVPFQAVFRKMEIRWVSF